MEKEQKESIANLMFHMVQTNYKEMCDKIKVAILDKFIELAENSGGYLTHTDLKNIRNGIEDLRTKDKEVETKAIVMVIDHLIARGDNRISKSNEVTNDGLPPTDESGSIRA